LLFQDERPPIIDLVPQKTIVYHVPLLLKKIPPINPDFLKYRRFR